MQYCKPKNRKWNLSYYTNNNQLDWSFAFTVIKLLHYDTILFMIIYTFTTNNEVNTYNTILHKYLLFDVSCWLVDCCIVRCQCLCHLISSWCCICRWWLHTLNHVNWTNKGWDMVVHVPHLPHTYWYGLFTPTVSTINCALNGTLLMVTLSGLQNYPLVHTTSTIIAIATAQSLNQHVLCDTSLSYILSLISTTRAALY